MRTGTIFAAIIAVIVLGFAVYMIDIDQTQEARLPDVDVQVEGGQAPEFDADVGDVKVGEETVEVEVPTLEVEPPAED